MSTLIAGAAGSMGMHLAIKALLLGVGALALGGWHKFRTWASTPVFARGQD